MSANRIMAALLGCFMTLLPSQAREVVQFYVQKPALSEGRPALELCAFGKTDVLAPGASQQLKVPLEGVVNPLEQWAGGAWTLAPGTYQFWAAASSADLRLNASLEVE